ncbi:MerR family transcriptional regulator [Enteractinococcus helveticum]|uniref:MerR family transcriptional regulator n=2 Tax=Enteractinococcus helveticum TaxID=1837282 RepID=A0A1B7LZ91_9MICC|nr:MerR family transcriptional regulator [Enteractinococcus helveticum]
MSIGEVLEHINAEFPEVRASKVRFLEERGLVTPARTAAGYRKYTQADVDRLRFILAIQRDQFLPLKVIKDYLDAIDAGRRPESLPGGLRLEPRSVSQQLAHEISGHIRPMTRAELQGMCGASDELMKTLESYRLIWPDETGRYNDHSLKVARAAVTLAEFGFEPRHLRPFRIAVDRELGMVQQATSGLGQHDGGVSMERAQEAAREITQACLRLHAGVVSAEIADMDD